MKSPIYSPRRIRGSVNILVYSPPLRWIIVHYFEVDTSFRAICSAFKSYLAYQFEAIVAEVQTLVVHWPPLRKPSRIQTIAKGGPGIVNVLTSVREIKTNNHPTVGKAICASSTKLPFVCTPAVTVDAISNSSYCFIYQSSVFCKNWKIAENRAVGVAVVWGTTMLAVPGSILFYILVFALYTLAPPFLYFIRMLFLKTPFLFFYFDSSKI